MHPGDHSGHVIDLGLDFASTPSPSIANRDELGDEQMMNTYGDQSMNEENYPSYQQVIILFRGRKKQNKI